ncbi:hypothetical protein E2562_007366 [Oryza meyeriana var. granulata]|uniref:Uncharacterized protein n=1 Tax=Oryza meyeriana var. granulata TaxID=110450 RepID=A0A6G1CZN5_9ORYZ|nr:hypothetical protein E2562_007366 [Oryza meyeriana var. granulata]
MRKKLTKTRSTPVAGGAGEDAATAAIWPRGEAGPTPSSGGAAENWARRRWGEGLRGSEQGRSGAEKALLLSSLVASCRRSNKK